MIDAAPAIRIGGSLSSACRHPLPVMTGIKAQLQLSVLAKTEYDTFPLPACGGEG
jgi:hypothetical protein